MAGRSSYHASGSGPAPVVNSDETDANEPALEAGEFENTPVVSLYFFHILTCVIDHHRC